MRQSPMADKALLNRQREWCASKAPLSLHTYVCVSKRGKQGSKEEGCISRRYGLRKEVGDLIQEINADRAYFLVLYK